MWSGVVCLYLPLVFRAFDAHTIRTTRGGQWGADIVVESATKWIGGHGTTIGRSVNVIPRDASRQAGSLA